MSISFVYPFTCMLGMKIKIHCSPTVQLLTNFTLPALVPSCISFKLFADTEAGEAQLQFSWKYPKASVASAENQITFEGSVSALKKIIYRTFLTEAVKIIMLSTAASAFQCASCNFGRLLYLDHSIVCPNFDFTI